jgi:CRP/FNR family transcriptional regulator
MKEEQRIESLKKVELFDSLNYEELRQITGTMAIKTFKKNEVILYEEDTNQFMYIILDGEAKVIQVTEDGKEIILAMHGTGDFFGELSIIDGKTAPASVVAMKHSITAIISKKDFFSLMVSQPKVLQKLLLILCTRFRESLGMIQMLNFNNALQRIKTLLLNLSDKYGEEEKEVTVIRIKLTHQNIAEMTGMTRETVTRAIDKLQKDGEITILKDRLIRLTQSFFAKI